MDNNDIDAIRRVLIRTAWAARRDERNQVRKCKHALEIGDESALIIESGLRSWWKGYKVARLHAAKLIRKQKAKVTNG